MSYNLRKNYGKAKDPIDCVSTKKKWGGVISLLLILFLAAACRPQVEQETYIVSLVADGRERRFQLAEPFTVEEFLRQPDVNVEIGENDRLTPPRFTQLTDQMRITIVRVTEETICEQENIPYEQETILNEGLQPGEQRILQVGKNGIQEVCYRITYEDGIAGSRIRTGQPTVIEAPTNEIVIVGLETTVEPVPVVGTLAYINNNNAWVIQGNSINKRPLTTTGNLDGLVLSLSSNGQYLIYTADPVNDEEFINELWLIATIGNLPPVQLVPTDVLYAEWMPEQENTISYSTGEVQAIFPFWDALNNVLTIRVDPTTGESLNVRQIVPESLGGLSGWWGTVYKWSPDGTRLAWVRADSAGIVGEEGEFIPLVEYALFRTSQNWSWRANISWSWDGQLLLTTGHGDPLGSEPAEASPVFDIVATSIDNSFEVSVAESAGMWAGAQFSPRLSRPDTRYEYGYMAYLRAREPYNSINGEYDLVVADRDGSNARVIFPPSGQPGIQSQITGLTAHDFAWSPDARQIAVIYQGNLWIVDVETQVAHQMTFDGQSKFPIWSP